MKEKHIKSKCLACAALMNFKEMILAGYYVLAQSLILVQILGICPERVKGGLFFSMIGSGIGPHF